MSYIADSGIPPLVAIAAGQVAGWSVVHKFGRHLAVGTSFVPISIGGVYLAPPATSASTMRVKAGGNAADTAAGTGAREVTIIGLDETGAEVTEAIATAGASASSATTSKFMRIYRAYVSAAGAYPTALTTGSHVADITVQLSSGAADMLTIDSTDIPRGQSEIGCYSVPLGFNAYVLSTSLTVAGTAKPTEIVLLQRPDILQSAVPYSAVREVIHFGGVEQSKEIQFTSPIKFPALTDIGFFAKAASGTPEVSVDFAILLESTT